VNERGTFTEAQLSWTIDDLVGGGYALSAHCHECNHSKDVDLSALIPFYGREAIVRGPVWIGRGRLRCSICGTRPGRGYNCSMRLSPPGLPRGIG